MSEASWRGRLAAVARQWPLIALLVALATALWLADTHHWRRSAFTIGSTMVLAAGMRAVLPEPMVRVLAARGRLLDAVLLAAAGVAICVLAMVVPGSP